jgi:hypothetical protein
LNLLDQIGNGIRGDKVPHVVAEGSSQKKLAQIYTSPYMKFGFERLAKSSESLVIIGHSLSNQDQHIVDILNSQNWRGRTIVYGIHATDTTDIRSKKRQIYEKLPYANLQFFSANSHPICHSSIRVCRRTVFDDFSPVAFSEAA